ncbi:unnamed protein product [Tuber aestivum]|uniref:Peptidase S1 domain-containing protein n=1 Tax=Tuber aestivum TaxID=59557 RepID=A0A292PUP2_9PEZI|nr:unnamed protein product [Tuber aestivum]
MELVAELNEKIQEVNALHDKVTKHCTTTKDHDYGVISDKEIHDLQWPNINNERCLLVIQNELTMGTTVGCGNGLESFTCTFDMCEIKHTSHKIVVLSYNKKLGRFPAAGDSGSILLGRYSCIVGLLSDHSGLSEETDIMYVIPR